MNSPFATRVILSRLLPPAGDERFNFKGEVVVPYPFSPPLDPSVNGVRILVTDASGGTVVDATIPGGSYDSATQLGWSKNTEGTSWVYRHVGDMVPKVNGIKRIVVFDRSSRDPGHLKFSVQGRQGTYPLVPADAPISATIIFDVGPPAGSSQCAEAYFRGPNPPLCTFGGDANLIVCRFK